MGSAVLLTYERHHYKRNPNRDRSTVLNTVMNVESKIGDGRALDVTHLDSSLPIDATSESDGKLLRPGAQSSFGTSANAPSETASEDSCSFKRKSVCLNGEALGNTLPSIPATYDFSQMNLTAMEKRDVRQKLKQQLDDVIRLLVRLEARESELSNSSRFAMSEGGHDEALAGRASVGIVQFDHRASQFVPLVTGGKEKRTPKVNQLYVNSEFFWGTDKVPPTEKQKLKPSAGVKRSSQEKLYPPGSKRQKIDNGYMKKMSDITRQCKTLLKTLMSHKHGWIFNEPVDVIKLGLHDYLTIIKKPMDLGTIKTKLDSNRYSLPSEFAEDVRLTFDNAMLYNPRGHFVNEAADMLKKLFESRWESLQEKIREVSALHNSMIQESEDMSPCKAFQVEANVSDSMNNAHNTNARSQRFDRPLLSKSRSEVAFQTMTLEEKCDLSRNIESLPNDKLVQVLQLIKSRCPNVKQTDEEIEVDIDLLGPETLWELQQMVNGCSKNQRRQAESIQANMMQPSNGRSNTACLRKLSSEGASGEKVLLGSDDLSSMNQAFRTKENTAILEKRTASSRQSDHDFHTCSDGDVDADHTQHADLANVSPGKVPASSDAICDQSSRPGLQNTAKRCTVSSFEGSISSKVAMPGAGIGGGGANSEEHVSPEKLLRAALLKGRFADTILKAQEKTLPLKKNDRSDPESLKREREELERRQREERARLQAEAKAAEQAKLKAEVDAVAREKRMREEEREAARIALQKMEKTVEIDENSEVLKDLEMLRTVQPEHILSSSSGEDASPVHTLERIPSFALQGGNPLEQLGLFMKTDEDEDEEHEKGLLLGNKQPDSDVSETVVEDEGGDKEG